MSVSSEEVRQLREQTGAGMLDCKKALQDCSGNFQAAIEYLRKKGISAADKKTSRETKQGLIVSYIHGGGRIGVLVEVNCETDFVARTEDFQAFTKDIAMHIAASGPLYLSREHVPSAIIQKEREIYKEQARQSGKPEPMLEKIVDGKLEKYFCEVCLMEQSFIKNPEVKIQNFIKEAIAKLGENIVISRYSRFELGRSSS